LFTQKQNCAKFMHVPPPEHAPPQAGAPDVSQNGPVVVVVEDVVVVVVVVVVVGMHASQQLVAECTVPPRASQRAASCWIVQRGTPFRARQHATAPGFPQVDFAAQRRITPRHCGRSWFISVRVRATSAAHATYAPCCVAPAQSQVASTSARAAATAAASPGAFPHGARAKAVPLPAKEDQRARRTAWDTSVRPLTAAVAGPSMQIRGQPGERGASGGERAASHRIDIVGDDPASYQPRWLPRSSARKTSRSGGCLPWQRAVHRTQRHALVVGDLDRVDAARSVAAIVVRSRRSQPEWKRSRT
jgi:hypothetical protein